MSQSTEEIRAKRRELESRITKMRNDLEVDIATGPDREIRDLVQECEKLGHPNKKTYQRPSLHWKCPDCWTMKNL